MASCSKRVIILHRFREKLYFALKQIIKKEVTYISAAVYTQF